MTGATGSHFTIARGDEMEILIRILSFSPVLKVIEPESMVSQIQEQLARQVALMAEE